MKPTSEVQEILNKLNAETEGFKIVDEHEQWISGSKSEYKYTRLAELTPEQFDVTLPFLCKKIEEPHLSKNKIRLLGRNRIFYVWELFVQDWKYFPDKELMISELLRQLEVLFGFTLDFRICFSQEQKAVLQKIN